MDIRILDREKSTDSVEGAAAQKSIDSVEGEEFNKNQQPTQSLRQVDVQVLYSEW